MSTAQHTPEPWDHRPIGYYRSMIFDASGSGIATFKRPEDAGRANACVNACAGLDLPDGVPVGALAEVVAALLEYVQRHEAEGAHPAGCPEYDRAVAALSKLNL